MSEGTGFSYSPGTILNQIKNLLKERYKEGFPIIKEIIQNANDGEATRLDFGLINGLGNQVSHPLLKCPALFFLNNGTFTREDAKAITYIGVDANAGNKGKIGKFGLGQKSVFHFCEAFFFIARSKNIPEGCGRFLNPYAPPDGIDRRRPDWVALSIEDRDIMEEYLRGQGLYQLNEERYFVLWIPLRHRDYSNDNIIANYYNLNSIQQQFPPDMADKIALLLPALKHLNEVHYWQFNIEKYRLEKQFNVIVDSAELQRCLYPKSDEDNYQPIERDLKGKVRIEVKQEEPLRMLKFAGKEGILNANYFYSLLPQVPMNDFWEELHQSDYWSKRSKIHENGDESNEPDKSIPHCAVIVSEKDSRQANQGYLKIQWAVFLPLAESSEKEIEEFELIPCQGNKDYNIFLHGYLFLDSGRNYIESLADIRQEKIVAKTPNKESEMVQQWNKILATQGTIKLILPSLKKFKLTHKSSAEDIYNLCTAFIKSKIFKSKIYRESICYQSEWVYCLHNKEWILLDRTKKVRVLPLPSNPNWDWFPNLSRIAQSSGYLLTLSHAPNLRFDNTTFDQWTDKEIIDALTNLSENILHNHRGINYLVSFLKECCQNRRTQKIESDEVQKHLIQFIKKGLSQLNWSELNSEIRNSLQKLINLIRDSEVIYIDVNENLFKDILQSEFSVLLLPKSLFILAPNSGFGKLNLEDARTILLNLNSLINRWKEQGKNNTILEPILKQVLNLSKNYVINILSVNSDWRCLIGSEYPQKTAIFYSYHDFQKFKRQSILFTNSEDSLINLLIQALDKIQPIVVDKQIAELLEKDQNISPIPCNLATCKNSLSQAPALALPERRKQLLTELLKEVH